MSIDVKKAHLNGELSPDEVAFVQLPGSLQQAMGVWRAASGQCLGEGRCRENGGDWPDEREMLTSGVPQSGNWSNRSFMETTSRSWGLRPSCTR